MVLCLGQPLANLGGWKIGTLLTDTCHTIALATCNDPRDRAHGKQFNSSEDQVLTCDLELIIGQIVDSRLGSIL